MKYVYPAIFTLEEGSYSVSFPDLKNCYTCGSDVKDALINAEDVLCLMLWDMEENKEEIPAPSNPSSVKCGDNSFLSLVSADTTAYRKQYDTRAIKKTLTIPHYLDELAKEKNINFSNLLQRALIKELGLQ